MSTVTTDRCVYSWTKNSREEVRATHSTFNGQEIGSIRVYVLSDSEELIPTKKGISVKVADLPHLRAAVDALIAATGE